MMLIFTPKKSSKKNHVHRPIKRGYIPENATVSSTPKMSEKSLDYSQP